MHLTDPFAEADEDTGETKQSQNYIHIRIQRTSTLLSSPSWLLLRLAGAKGGYMLTTCSATERNGRKTLTTVQGLPKKFDQKKILKVIKKKFGMSFVTYACVSGPDANYILACNGTIVSDTEMGEVIQLQGDQRKDVQEFLTDKKEGLELDAKTIKVCRCPSIYSPSPLPCSNLLYSRSTGSNPITDIMPCSSPLFPVYVAL